MRARLIRTHTGPEGTFGKLFAGPNTLHTAEPPWKNNERNVSCIPEGVYEVRPHLSPRFGPCLVVMDVGDRSHILFHAGNFAGDPDLSYKTHTQGCILVGRRAGVWAPTGKKRQRAVWSSRPALRTLLRWADKPFDLEITR